MDEILEDIKKIEFEEINYHELSDDYFGMIKGEIPILISAPHGARHLRFSQEDRSLWKEEDEYTAAIAIKLGQLTGAHVIYVKNKTVEDSNFEKVTRYKKAVKDVINKHSIRFLADIHGLDKDKPSKGNPSKIIVGIIDEKDMKMCSCPEFRKIIEECFKGFQEPLFNVGGYNAGSQGTMTYFAKHVCGIEAAQFEINVKYRIVERRPDSSKAIQGVDPDFKANGKDITDMFSRLKEMILKIKEKLETK